MRQNNDFKRRFSQLVRHGRRGGNAAAGSLRGESLEPRWMLNAADWAPAEVNDEAAAFFDDSFVHEIHITFDDANWYDILYDSHANDADDPYFEASFEGDGIELTSVGVRFKGNSSFDGTGAKKSIKIDFDEFVEDSDDELTFLGLTKLNLNNNYKDPTMLREKLFYDFASNFVEAVSRAVHTTVYINGEYYGLYTAVEQVDKTFVQSRFGSDEDGNLYKGSASDDLADDPQADFGSDLTWLGSDESLYDDFYQLKTNETAYDYSELVEFIDVLNNTPSGELSDAIEPLLDVDDTLASLALNNLFVNLDSYSGAAHNYYLYDRDDTGEFTHVFWDANESFAQFLQFTAPGTDPIELDPFWLPVATQMGPPGTPQTGEDEERPLIKNLLEIEEYGTEYLRDLAEMLRKGFDGESATARVNELADLIRADVDADPNKEYTTAQFQQNLTTDIVAGRQTIYGLTSFVEQRSAYLTSALAGYAEQSDVALNEVMSVNVATVQDEFGDYDPWVELFNNGPGSVNLAGLYLTDDASDLTKWAIPSSDLGDGGFLTVWLDGEASEGAEHASFALSATGGNLFLSDGITLIESVTYGAMDEDMSFAKLPDGVGDWQSTDQPTAGAANLARRVSTELVVLYINEFMADNDTTIEDPDEAGAYEDWIELYNPGADSIELGGMYLTDNRSDPVQWQFPAGSTIAAGGYFLVWADGDTDQGADHTSFKLSSGGETVALFNTDGATLIDSYEYDVQMTDASYGRYADGTDNWIFMSTSTPGSANVAGAKTGEWSNSANQFDVDGDGDVSPRDAHLVINELTFREYSDPTTGALNSDTRPAGAGFLDVTKDSFIAPLDALFVINFLPASELAVVVAAAAMPSDSTAFGSPGNSNGNYVCTFESGEPVATDTAARSVDELTKFRPRRLHGGPETLGEPQQIEQLTTEALDVVFARSSSF